MGVQVKTVVKQVSTSASEGSARNHTYLIDRPEAKGGGNQGPMGGELMLMGIGGCFMSNLLAAVAARKLDITDLSVDVAAELEDSPPRFTNIALTVNSVFPDKALLRELAAGAEASCLAVNTVKAATGFSVELG